jgi:hypothetical protein
MSFIKRKFEDIPLRSAEKPCDTVQRIGRDWFDRPDNLDNVLFFVVYACGKWRNALCIHLTVKENPFQCIKWIQK